MMTTQYLVAYCLTEDMQKYIHLPQAIKNKQKYKVSSF